MKDNLKDVGIWGQRHYQYLKEEKPSVIGVMRLNGSLNAYLQQVNEAGGRDVLSAGQANGEGRGRH